VVEKNTLLVREPAHVLAAKAVRSQILGGILVPGAQLRQDEVGKMYGVSQATVREAFRSLEAEGLLMSIPNRGMFVTQVTVDYVIEVYDLRENLEILALTKSFPHLCQAHFLQAKKLLEQSEKKENFSLVGPSNRAFHAIFYSAGELTLTIDLIERCFGGITPSWMRFIREQPDKAAQYGQTASRHHWDLLRACQAGSLEEAKSALSVHLRDACSMLTEFMNETQDEKEPPR
jgi:DNA-binding GntR family transcriptional regulator